MNGDSIDVRDSQGLISNTEGDIKQQYGDRTEIKTEGGDAAGRDSYKKNIVLNFIFGEKKLQNISQEDLQGLDFIHLLNSSDRDNIYKAYQETLHCDDAHLWSFETTDLVEILKILSELRRLPEFFDDLSQDKNISPLARQYFQKIVQKFAEDRNLKLTKKTTPDLSCHKLDSYLLATLQSHDRSKKEFLLNAWLIIDDSVEGLAKFQSLLDADEQQQGVLCEFDRVPLQLNQFLEKSLKLLRNKEYHLTIEFFLPSHLMCTEIDRWKLNDPIDDELKLGIKYPIRLRSLERLDINYLDSYHSDWKDRWDNVKTVWHSDAIAESFEHLDCMDSFNWKEWRAKLKQKIGLKLTCALPQPKQKDLFRAILSAATPIAIWTRCDVVTLDRVAAIDGLLNNDRLCNLCERVRQMREDADVQMEEHLGLHLAILWENPHRLTPDIHKILMETGQ